MPQSKAAHYSSRTADKFVVRWPDGMRERIAERARQHHRSMNSEIVAVLERSLETSEDTAEQLDHLRHVGEAFTTPLQTGILAWYEYTEGKHLELGQITAIAVNGPVVHVTFDQPKLARLPSFIAGSHVDDPRIWVPIHRVKPYVI